MPNSTSKRLSRDERIVAHYRRLAPLHAQGRGALTAACTACGARAAEAEAALRAAGIEVPAATKRLPTRAPSTETIEARFMRLWRARVAGGCGVRRAIHLTRAGTHQTVAECEAILRAHGIEPPPRGDAHTAAADPADRAAVLYERRLAGGKAPGGAVTAVAAAMKRPAGEVRRLLAARGIHPEPSAPTGGRRRAEPKAPRAPKPRRGVRAAEPGPVLRAAYSDADEAPCRIPSAQERLDGLRAGGERGRFVPVREIFRGWGARP